MAPIAGMRTTRPVRARREENVLLHQALGDNPRAEAKGIEERELCGLLKLVQVPLMRLSHRVAVRSRTKVWTRTLLLSRPRRRSPMPRS